MLPKISVIIPVRNDGVILRRCLESLRSADYPKDRLEVIVVDGLSTDDTAKVAASYGARVIPNEKRLVAPARNIGFAASTGEIAAYIDADCVVDKGWLANCVKYFDDKTVGGVSGPTLPPPEAARFEKAVEVIFNMSELFRLTSHRRRIKESVESVDLPGCNAIFRRAALDKAMPVGEHLVAADDSLISFRVRQAGYKLLFAPDVTLWHYHHNPPRKFYIRMIRYSIGRLQAAKIDSGMISVWHVLLGLSIPIFLSVFITFALAGALKLFLGFAALAAVLMFAAGIVRTRSFVIAAEFIWASILFAFGWSYGFLSELLFPPKAADKKRER